jgi:hypothetical protein
MLYACMRFVNPLQSLRAIPLCLSFLLCFSQVALSAPEEGKEPTGIEEKATEEPPLPRYLTEPVPPPPPKFLDEEPQPDPLLFNASLVILFVLLVGGYIWFRRFFNRLSNPNPKFGDPRL